jgi:hypothetical protein
MNRKQTVLIVALAAQVLLLVLLKAPFAGSAEASAVRALLPELEELTATRLAIGDGQGGSVGLTNTGTGWTLDEADGYPADDTKVDSLLLVLRDLKIRRPVVTSSRYHDQLKVGAEDHERRVRIWSDAAADPEVDFLVGASPNYRISDVRRQDEDEVYEVMGLSAFDVEADLAAWIEKKVVDVPAEDVTGLKVTNGNGTFQLARLDDAWTVIDGPSGGELDQTAVDSLIRAYASIFMAEPVGKLDAVAHGLDAPVGSVELTCLDAEPTILNVGHGVPGEETKFYASVAGTEFTVILNSFDAERATDKKLDDLLVSEAAAE